MLRFSCFVLVLLVSIAAHGQEAATQPADSKAGIKVGVLVSEYTAAGPHAGAQEYGYAHAAIAGELEGPSITVIPIIDPGTESETPLAEAIKEHFPKSDGKVLNAGDAEALKTLDVIVLAAVPNLKDEVIDAVTTVVSDGTPLLVVGRCGNLNPGYGRNQKIPALVGMSKARFAWTRAPATATVVAKHDPLIKGLAEEWSVTVAGGHGALNEGYTTLVKLTGGELRLPGDQAKGEEEDYFVMYQTKLENGPVLVCNWSKLPEQLTSLEGEKFYVRCAKRLVKLKKGAAGGK